MIHPYYIQGSASQYKTRKSILCINNYNPRNFTRRSMLKHGYQTSRYRTFNQNRVKEKSYYG